MLQLLAAREPTVLILEDLHWAEPTLIELHRVHHCGGRHGVAARDRLLDAARARRDRARVLGTDGRRRTIELGTLDREQAAALLTDLLGDPALVQTAFAVVADLERRGKSAVPRRDGADAARPRPRRRGAWRSEEMGELPVPTSVQGLISSRLDRLEGGDKEPGAQRGRRRRGLLGGRGRAPRHRGRPASDRSPRGPGDARASRLRPPQRGLDRRRRRRVRVQAHPDARRRVRTGPEGPTRGAPRPLLRLGDEPPGKRRRVRRDRRVAPRAGVPPLPRGGPQPDRAAAAAGGRSARERRPPRRTEGRPPRGRAVLHAGARRAWAKSIPECSSTSASGAQTS